MRTTPEFRSNAQTPPNAIKTFVVGINEFFFNALIDAYDFYR